MLISSWPHGVLYHPNPAKSRLVGKPDKFLPVLHFSHYRVYQAVETCRGSIQAINRDHTEKEIFVVVGNSGCHDPASALACWAVHA